MRPRSPPCLPRWALVPQLMPSTSPVLRLLRSWSALNLDAYERLEGAFRGAVRDPEARCVIVTGADPAFCSGDDVVELMATPRPPTDASPVVRHRPTPAAMAALECDKPVIAAVNGPAGGWGMELAPSARLRSACEPGTFAE